MGASSEWMDRWPKSMRVSDRTITLLRKCGHAVNVVVATAEPAVTLPESMSDTAPRAAAKRGRSRTKARVGRPPGQLSEVTRKKILVAARDCFARMGFERATNRDIAAAAGITAAALYRYYDSKADLYAGAVRDNLAVLVPRMREAVESAPNARAAIASLLRGAVDKEQLAASRFLTGVSTEMQRHPEVARCMLADPGEVYALVRGAMERGVRNGELPRDKLEPAVALVVASLMGLSDYTATLGQRQGQQALSGLLALLEGQLFSPVARK